MVDGGHFFIDTRRDIVLGYVANALVKARDAEMLHDR
jgi:surfactin synthase thioesterase subunit